MRKITFWDLISSPEIKKICIPTIQRDYALGRRNKADNRNSFLNALKSAICAEEQLPLDFVYGVDNETMFVPLDGQQRLTTLWLLHWYIAYKSDKLYDKEVKKTLQKFSYETRISSTDFCKSLCDLTPIPTSEKQEKVSIRTWITQQTWFFHQYKQDPTISGMLNMIAGTEISKNGNDIIDGLEELFSDKEYDFLHIWNQLTTSPGIVFHKLKVSLDDSDELYVKMNARGKQLTDFENFKTELVHYAKEENILGESEALDFAAKLDVQWTDIFWGNRWEDAKTNDISIDEIYFAFIRRYVRLECIKKNGDKSPLLGKIDRTFTSFEPYKKVLDKQSIDNFISIMDNLRVHKLEPKSSWGTNFDFIPRYTSDKKKDITTAQNTELLIFYGCCAYLLYGEYDSKSFEEWERVLWNICENRVDKSKFQPTITEIDILAPHSHDIITFLSQKEEIDCRYNKEQLLEEQCKARHLSEYPSIKDMEHYAFFKGAIRFLYTGVDGNEDWSNFEAKSKNIKKVIPENKEDRHTIKDLTPYISKQGLCKIYYNWTSNNDEDLRYILLSKDSTPFLHNFLIGNNEKEPLTSLHKDIIDICENAYGGSGYLQSNWSESKYIWTNYQKRSGYYAWASYVVGSDSHLRVSMIIDESEEFVIHQDLQRKRIGNHFPSLYVHFKYGKHYLSLYGNDTICLMTDNWESKWINPNDKLGYYFSIENITSKEELIDEIECTLKKIEQIA